jgi:hypothetical protein
MAMARRIMAFFILRRLSTIRFYSPNTSVIGNKGDESPLKIL